MRYVLYSAGTQPINKHFLQMRRHILDRDVIGCVQKDIVFWDDRGYGRWFWSEDDVRRINKDGEKLLNQKVAKKSILLQRKAVRDYWSAAKRLLKAVEDGACDEELAGEYWLYSEALRRAYAHFQTSVSHTTHTLESTLYEILEDRFHGDARKNFSLLTTPARPDLIYEELKDWANVLKNPSEARIVSHSRKYPFLLPNFFSEQEVLAWAKKRMRIEPPKAVSARLKECLDKKSDLKKQQIRILAEASSEKASYASSVLREFALTRLLIKNCWNGEAFHMLPFFKHVAKKAKCSIEDAYMFHTSDEIRELLSIGKNIPRKELTQRKKHCLLHFSRGKITMYSGKDALMMRRKLLDPSIPGRDVTEFKGTTANMGRIAGRVFILKEENPAKFHALSRGLTKDNILVTGMTNPAMAIFMNRIGGIITDEGGAACHAAVISREFNLPCLVGCKVATLVLEDGDTIILDADNGLVRRISASEYRRQRKKHAHARNRSTCAASCQMTTAKDDIMRLSEISRADITSVGGKAANLGELYGSFPVPEAFSLTTKAFDEFVKEHDLGERIAKLDAIRPDDVEALEEAGTKIRELITGMPLPKGLTDRVVSEYRRLKSKKVAVRSSATAEDTEKASFAGQHDTYLDVGEKDIIQSIKKCWASFFNLRAIIYRKHNGIPSAGAGISVLIQRMVDADFAGVIFTRDPIRKKHVLMEVVRGLGEKLVSGEVTPSSYMVDRKTHFIVEEREPILQKMTVTELAKTAMKIEAKYGNPQDIEFAIRKGRIFILQSRPITTL